MEAFARCFAILISTTWKCQKTFMGSVTFRFTCRLSRCEFRKQTNSNDSKHRWIVFVTYVTHRAHKIRIRRMWVNWRCDSLSLSVCVRECSCHNAWAARRMWKVKNLVDGDVFNINTHIYLVCVYRGSQTFQLFHISQLFLFCSLAHTRNPDSTFFIPRSRLASIRNCF